MDKHAKAESPIDRLGIDLKIMTPETVLADRPNLAWVRLVLANENTITIWPGHAPLVAETADGPIMIMDRDNFEMISLAPALLKVTEDSVTLLTQCDKASCIVEPAEPNLSSADINRLADELLAMLYADPSEFGQKDHDGEWERSC